jgi:hypothetical protein
MRDFNYFNRLRPWTDLELCDCARIDRLLLVYTLTDNPIHCFACKGAVDPETISLSEDQVDIVCRWHSTFRALYDLWLNSGEYETWAKTQLLKPAGEVNVSGLAAAAALSKSIPTYYWWFHEEGDPILHNCPSCSMELGPETGHGHGQCDACQIVV